MSTLLQQVRGAVARGWRHGKNQEKEMDVDLAEAITTEVMELIRPMIESNNRNDLFITGDFTLHSNDVSKWKIECDALTDNEIATLAMIANEKLQNTPFGDVVGIARGGLKMAEAMRPYIKKGSSTVLIVDDVLTTGVSMKMKRQEINDRGIDVIGLVIFARSNPEWVKSIFQMK